MLAEGTNRSRPAVHVHIQIFGNENIPVFQCLGQPNHNGNSFLNNKNNLKKCVLYIYNILFK